MSQREWSPRDWSRWDASDMDGQTREGETTSASAPSTETTAKMKPNTGARRIRSNEKEMSDGGRERASLGVEVCKSCQKWSVQRSAVRSSVWLDAFIVFAGRCIRRFGQGSSVSSMAGSTVELGKPLP
jgi:hypothetical protein